MTWETLIQWAGTVVIYALVGSFLTIIGIGTAVISDKIRGRNTITS